MILVNGQAAQSIGVTDRAVQFGDGVFETIAVAEGQALCLDEHLQRLQQGCQRLQIQAVDLEPIRADINSVIARQPDCIIKLIVSRGESAQGYAVPTDIRATRIVSGSAWPTAGFADSLRVCLCQTRLGQNPQLAGIKHLNRLEQVLARREVDLHNCDEGVVLDNIGNVIEGTGSNLFLLLEGQLVTPDLEQCGIAGIVRGKILNLAGELGLQAVVRQVQVQELQQASEMFFCNSIRGIQSVAEYAGQALPQSTTAEQIRAALIDRQVIRG
ncbi:MAG: aminodeoxychorismate lyase [Gammaproteobacteria bacterium]